MLARSLGNRPRIALVAAAGVLVVGFLTRGVWLPWIHPAPATDSKPGETPLPPNRTFVSEQAQKNLRITAKPLVVDSFWKTIQVPGMIVDRPTQRDRYVIAPVEGVVTAIDRVPGDTIRAGDKLFTLKLLSESLHQTQADLIKTTQDIAIATAERNRLAALSDILPASKFIEIDNHLARLKTAADASRQDLLSRGLSAQQVARISAGHFETEIAIGAPVALRNEGVIKVASTSNPGPEIDAPSFELQEMKVEPGQQVQAGQTLCLLSNHRALTIEGRAFREETPLLEQSLKEKWPVEVDFQEEATGLWPDFKQPLYVEHLASVIDPVNRTFSALIPLENEARAFDEGGRAQTMWRFRPGQKVQIRVKVEQLTNVFVLPVEAVTHDGPDAFLFTQNANMFDRKAVHVLFQDRRYVVVANDGTLMPGMFVVQTAAAQLNRMVKSQTSTVPKGFHMHADGSIHKNGDD